MELTLTGASTLSDRPAASTASHSHDHSHSHGHSHGHSHSHSGGTCCAPPKPKKIDASVLLPTPEQVNRFKSDKSFRLQVLSNVVRGGTYEIFINLIQVLVNNDKKAENDIMVKIEDYEAFGNMLNGHGADGHTLAHWCAKRGDDPRFLKFLIAKSTSPNGTTLLIDLHLPSKDTVGMYPLHWAVTEGAIPLVSLLLQHLEDRPTPSARTSSCSSLMHSTSSLMEGSDDQTNAPINNCTSFTNAGIDAQDSSGCTPLLIAAQYGHPDLAAFLIQRGANPNNVDSSRDTALHWAAYKGSVEVCGMLLHLQGVEGQLDSVDAFGQTPLHLASLRGNVETVRFLMEEAASISVSAEKEGGGRVGSKVSAKSSHCFPAKLLTMTDKEEKTPLDLAVKKKKLGCEMLLLQYHEQYVAPKRGVFSRVGQTIKDICSINSWKAWMGMTGSELPIGQNPTFPFYWMVAHIFLAGIVYATEFIGIGKSGKYEAEGLLWDKLGLHFFFIAAFTFTLITLYYTFRTNPGVLDARDVGNSSNTTPTCQVLCCGGGGGYPKDKISLEMDAVTKKLRSQYDAVIESFSKNFPSEDKRVPLCHTCRIVKPLRSKHCRVARRCVLLFDHHCPFVGTTIGLYNYIHFYMFLVSFLMMAIGFITAWIIFLKRSTTFPTGVAACGGYLSLYFIPVSMMVVYHTQLILGNLSTNEQANLRRYRYFWAEGRFRNPFDHGKIRNILSRLSPDRSAYELGIGGANSEETESMLANEV